jgi:hypothetical protein
MKFSVLCAQIAHGSRQATALVTMPLAEPGEI